jgi:hypothetical protein
MVVVFIISFSVSGIATPIPIVRTWNFLFFFIILKKNQNFFFEKIITEAEVGGCQPHIRAALL